MKIIFKKLVAIFIVLLNLFLLSCEKESFEEPKKEEHFTIKEYNLNEANKIEKFKLLYSKFSQDIASNKLNSREVDSLGFEIDSTQIKEIIYNNKVSYTLSIKRLIETEEYFENLVLEVDSLNQKYAYIIKYFPTEPMKYVDNHDELLFQGNVIVEKYAYPTSFGDGSGLNNEWTPITSGDATNCIWVLKCNYGGSVHNAGSNCTPAYTFFALECTGYPNGSGSYGGSGNNTSGPGGYYGGNGSSTTNNPNPPNQTPVVTVPIVSITNQPITDSDPDAATVIGNQFYNQLNNQEKLYVHSGNGIYQILTDYLSLHIENNIIELEALDFANELVDLSKSEFDQTDVYKLTKLSTIIENSGANFFTEELELSLDPYTDLDIGGPISTLNPNYTSVKIFLDYKKLRQLYPQWSRAKCLWYASKEIVHLSLDVFGLIPVAGEVGDIVNGVLYTIEGDGLNATLSYASAVPLVGWVSATTKFGFRVVTTVTGKTTLAFKIVGDVVQYGSRSQLRKVLNLTTGNPLQAHHIIPWNKQSKSIVQRASKSENAFHMNEALNGIPLSTAVHSGSHANYDNVIQTKFDLFNANNPNATPDECYDFLTDLINDVRTWIAAHPNTPINNIVLP